jgi:hypothetical protein
MRPLLIALAASLLFTSCRFLGGERINGDGRIVTQPRNVGNFTGVEAGGAVEVRLRQDAATSVKIEADENLQQYIEAFVNGMTLVVRQKQGYNLDPTNAIVIYVSAPQYENLDISGASKLIGETPITGDKLELTVSGASDANMEVKLSKLQADLSGSSTLQLKGSSSTVDTQASGASKLKCMDLVTDETTLDLSGASNAEVTANKQLNIEASGASDVKYRGNANINQKSSGASSVTKVS